MGTTLTRLTRLTAEPVSAGDGPLLDAFLAGDQGAFAALVRRHAGLVFATCRRILRHQQDAEDAFQATFLVLARRAADVWPREAVGSWLFGVAHRVALKAREKQQKRSSREKPLEDVFGTEPAPADFDLLEAVHRVISKLPVIYRAAVVACDLQGLSRKEAAARLGWCEGTLSGRLARARELLAARLRRLGYTLPAGGLAALATPESASAATIQSTVELATGAATGAVSVTVAALTEGMVRSMALVKLKAMTAAVLTACVIGFGVFAASGAGVGDGDKASGETKAPSDKAPPPVNPVPLAPKAQGEKPKLDLEVARGQLEFAWEELAKTLKWQQDWINRGQRSIDTPDELEREIARFRADVERLERLLKSSQTALDATRAAGPGVKVSGDLTWMQGRWRVDTKWDGKQQRPLPAKDAPTYEIVGNKMYGPFRDSEKKEARQQYTVVLRPEKTPAEIDLLPSSGQPALRGIYRFAREWEPGAGNLWLSVAPSGPRPTSFDGKDGPPGAIELTRVADDSKAGASRVVEGVNLKPAEQRWNLAYQELQLFLAEEQQRRRPFTTLEQFEGQLERAKNRVNALQQLFDQAEKEFEKEKARAKAAAPDSRPPAPAKDGETFSIHIRTLTAAEKVVRVKATGKQTVLEGLVHAADDVSIKPDSVSVWVVRDKAVLPVDLVAIIRNADAKTNYVLKPGDQLFVQAKAEK